MANKKRKGGNRKPKTAPQKKPAGQPGQKASQGTSQRSPEKGSGGKPADQGSRAAPDGKPSDRPGNKTSDRSRNKLGQKGSGAGAGLKGSGQKGSGQRSGSGSSRRAAQRRAAKRKRQMLTVGLPIVIVIVLVVLVIALNGGPQGSGKIASAADVKVSGPPRTTVIAEGQQLPTFSAPGLNGGTISSAQGQPSVLAIWASWCPECQKELPLLNRVKDGFPGVKVAAITTSQGQDPGPTPEQFVADNKITIPVAVDDANGDLRTAYGVTSFPTLYFVNADGTVYKNNIGLLDEATLNQYFTTLQAQADKTSPTPAPKPTSKPAT